MANGRVNLGVLDGPRFKSGPHPGLVVNRLHGGGKPVCDFIAAEDGQARRRVLDSPGSENEPFGVEYDLLCRHVRLLVSS